MRLAFALASLAIVGAASAASKEYDFTVPTTTTNFTSVQSVPRFDPTLGTLQSVTFGLLDSMTTTIWLENYSSSPGTTTITGVVNGAFSLVNDASPSTTYVTGGTLSVTKGQGDTFGQNSNHATDYASPYGIKYAPTTVSDSAYTTSNSSAMSLLNDFTGTTPISLRYVANGTHDYTADNGNGKAVFVTTASAKGYVIYNYQAVPEPSSVAALGLGALGLLRRRKGARK